MLKSKLFKSVSESFKPVSKQTIIVKFSDSKEVQ